MDAKALLLTTAFRHVINEPNIESGFERFATLTGTGIGYDAFRDAVAACLHEGLIREPIRLPVGALQCHWHLELTPGGVTAARSLVMAGSGLPPVSSVQRPSEAVDGRAKPGRDEVG